VLFRKEHWAGLAEGSVTLAFRRWRRPSVKPGGRLITPVGVLAIDELRPITEDEITAADARKAGFADLDSLLGELAGREGDLYRVGFHRAGDDPRIALRNRAELGDDDVAELTVRLRRLDRASRHGPWTEAVLRLIGERPGVRAGDLAESLGRERLSFKTDVRKLKALGLTESLAIGYRLSPRGQAWLARAGTGS
jgi:hypothetical protein